MYSGIGLSTAGGGVLAFQVLQPSTGLTGLPSIVAGAALVIGGYALLHRRSLTNAARDLGAPVA